MRRSRSWYVALRRAKYKTTAKTAMLRMSAVAYHTVIRARILSTLRAHHVSHAAHRVDQLGLLALVDLLAQPRDDDVDDIRAGIEVIVPGILRDEGARHDTALMPHQILEDGVFFWRQLDRFAITFDLAAAGVEHETVHFEHRRRDCLRPPAQCLDAR